MDNLPNYIIISLKKEKGKFVPHEAICVEEERDINEILKEDFKQKKMVTSDRVLVFDTAKADKVLKIKRKWRYEEIEPERNS